MKKCPFPGCEKLYSSVAVGGVEGCRYHKQFIKDLLFILPHIRFTQVPVARQPQIIVPGFRPSANIQVKN